MLTEELGVKLDSVRLEDLGRAKRVEEKLQADVPVGTFLSGGVDSALQVALLRRVLDRPVRTFTIGFESKKHDESDLARATAAELGTEHTELVVTPDQLMAVVPSLPRIYDEPFADPSQIPTFLLSRLARRHVTVGISGDGGDELFAGYERYGSAPPKPANRSEPKTPNRGWSCTTGRTACRTRSRSSTLQSARSWSPAPCQRCATPRASPPEPARGQRRGAASADDLWC